MVYKKIGNKIPSLSSLLLAGVLLGSSCPSKKDKDGAATEQASNHEGGAGQTPEGAKGAGKVFSEPYRKAAEKILKCVVTVSGVDHLARKPMVLDEDDLKDDSKEVKQKVEGLFRSFTIDRYLQAYPSSLQGCFAGLSDKKFKSFASGAKTGTKHKYAYGSAINEIAKFWNGLHVVYEKMMKQIERGAAEDEMANLEREVDRLLLQVRPNDGSISMFSKDHKFYDSKKATMLTGDQLARFLTDLAQDGSSTKPNSYGIPALLNEKTDVLIKVKNDSPIQPGQLIDSLDVRGSGILDAWFVYLNGKDKPSKNKMPAVDAFPNMKAGALKSLDLTQLSVGTSKPSAQEGNQVEKLSFAQLLFTLFRGGKQGVDFIRLERGTQDENDAVKLIGDDANFQNVIKVAKESNEAFARLLGKHIDEQGSQLQNLFVIPDAQAIRDKIKQETEQLLGDSANIGGDNTANNEKIGPGSLSEKIVDNILNKIFGIGFVSLSDSDKKGKLQAIAALYSNSDLTTSDILFEHKVGIEVIHEIYQGKGKDAFFENQDDKSGIKLIKLIDSVIDKCLSQAIVYKSGGEYKPTNVTIKIAGWLMAFHNALGSKHGNASITYKDIETVGSNQQTGFSIETVRKAMEEDCKKLKSILAVRVAPILALKDEKVNYSTYLPNLPLLKSDYETLDRIRLEYLNTSKAPGA